MKIRQKKAENRFPAVLTGAMARLSSKNRLFFYCLKGGSLTILPSPRPEGGTAPWRARSREKLLYKRRLTRTPAIRRANAAAESHFRFISELEGSAYVLKRRFGDRRGLKAGRSFLYMISRFPDPPDFGRFKGSGS